jgi:hypothetical protein
LIKALSISPQLARAHMFLGVAQIMTKRAGDGSVGVDILQESDPCCVGRGANGVELHCDVAYHVEIVLQRCAIPPRQTNWLGSSSPHPGSSKST